MIRLLRFPRFLLRNITSVSYDSNCMNDIFCELDDLLAVAGYNENCIITSCNVLDAICKLNPAKATVMVV